MGLVIGSSTESASYSWSAPILPEVDLKVHWENSKQQGCLGKLGLTFSQCIYEELLLRGFSSQAGNPSWLPSLALPLELEDFVALFSGASL